MKTEEEIEIELTGETIYEIIVDSKSGEIRTYRLNGTISTEKHENRMEYLRAIENKKDEMAEPYRQAGVVSFTQSVFPKTVILCWRTKIEIDERVELAVKKAMEDFEDYNRDIHNTTGIPTITNVDDNYRYKHKNYSYVYKSRMN